MGRESERTRQRIENGRRVDGYKSIKKRRRGERRRSCGEILLEGTTYCLEGRVSEQLVALRRGRDPNVLA